MEHPSSIPLQRHSSNVETSSHKSQRQERMGLFYIGRSRSTMMEQQQSENAAAMVTCSSPNRRSVSFRKYEVSGTMNRLRSTMVGGNVQQQEVRHDSSESAIGHLSLLDPLELGHLRQDDSLLHYSSKSRDMRANTIDKPTRPAVLFRCMSCAASQVPAIVLIGLFHLMIGIPFGVSYFPIGWRNAAASSETEMSDDNIQGPFPLLQKEALGIRMFLFSTLVGQVVFVQCSRFVNPIGLQMVENVPFTHALSTIVIERQGYGMESLSTLFVMFGLASILVGAVFMVLGKLELGRIVYYFPTHVLVGCIGGIGLYLCKTGLEVTLDAVLTVNAVLEKSHLWGVVILFEAILRILEQVLTDQDGKPKYSLLSPIYFCMMTPIFYGMLFLLKIDLQDAQDAGYFFPSLETSNNVDSSWLDSDLLDIWRVVDFSVVSWKAIVDSIPTLVALTLFSLIHVPINIPAFALSTNTNADMNQELVAHGYSNMVVGAFCGLQNYMAYTQSVLYDKSGGRGKASGLAVAAVTGLLFFVGPTIASYIPRCMAGTLLLHVGIDLFLEGVYDSCGKFDRMEYGSIWLIVVVMTLYGMDAAMIAGVITAISTYVVQNMTYVNPVRGSMSAVTLRSSQLNRSHKAQAILDNPMTGRGRILVVQLQGHLFFGNMAHLTSNIHRLLQDKSGTDDEPMIIIIDFSLVLGIDSSAAQAMTKLKNAMQKQYHVRLSIFVSGSNDGFPCEFDLSRELSAPSIPKSPTSIDNSEKVPVETTGLLSHDSLQEATEGPTFPTSHVSDSLNSALVFAENVLIDTEDPSLLDDKVGMYGKVLHLKRTSSLEEETDAVLLYLENLCPGQVDKENVKDLFFAMERQVVVQGDFLWKQGAPSTCMKLLVRGTLIAVLENEAGTRETIAAGNTIGELGLVEGVPRMSSVECLSEDAILYSLSRDAYQQLVTSAPHAARVVDLICVRYLSARVQHVSNRIFETRCLPI